MKIAVDEAIMGMRSNHGGPFGAVIVKDDEVIAKAHNMVLATNDPTAHAEITAIRQASSVLQRFDLSDCELYSTCEPCPMCFAAIHWARFLRLIYGCTRDDAAEIGFDDKYIYDVIRGTSEKQGVETVRACHEQCLVPFEEWKSKSDKVMY